MCDGCTTCGCNENTRQFSDSATYDAKTKTLVSVRDGVQEYLGYEIGETPPNKMFKIFRSRETIKGITDKLKGIKVTDEHVPLDMEPIRVVGETSSSEFLDHLDRSTATTGVIKNKVGVTDNVLSLIVDGKRELSLGYHADLVPHDDYDFEQVNIRPHHLAILDRGRCGQICSFKDNQGREMKETKLKAIMKKFTDQEGEPTLQQIVELVAALPEAIKNVPMDKLKELAPALIDVIAAAKEAGVEIPADEPTEEVEETVEDGDTMEDEATEDEGGEVKEDEPTEDQEVDEDGSKEMNDSKPFSDADVKKVVDVAVADALKIHNEVIQKAMKFVDGDYSFEGKSTDQIMRDVLALDSKDTFSDAELPIAFKLLKPKGRDYTGFGDSASDALNQLADKEV